MSLDNFKKNNPNGFTYEDWVDGKITYFEFAANEGMIVSSTLRRIKKEQEELYWETVHQVLGLIKNRFYESIINKEEKNALGFLDKKLKYLEWKFDIEQNKQTELNEFPFSNSRVPFMDLSYLKSDVLFSRSFYQKYIVGIEKRKFSLIKAPLQPDFYTRIDPNSNLAKMKFLDADYLFYEWLESENPNILVSEAKERFLTTKYNESNEMIEETKLKRIENFEVVEGINLTKGNAFKKLIRENKIKYLISIIPQELKGKFKWMNWHEYNEFDIALSLTFIGENTLKKDRKRHVELPTQESINKDFCVKLKQIGTLKAERFIKYQISLYENKLERIEKLEELIQVHYSHYFKAENIRQFYIKILHREKLTLENSDRKDTKVDTSKIEYIFPDFITSIESKNFKEIETRLIDEGFIENMVWKKTQNELIAIVIILHGKNMVRVYEKDTRKRYNLRKVITELSQRYNITISDMAKPSKIKSTFGTQYKKLTTYSPFWLFDSLPNSPKFPVID